MPALHSMQNQRISFFCKIYKLLAEVTSFHTVPFLLHKVNAQSRLYGGVCSTDTNMNG